jgi:DNA (cytosine-5)-methyltransferase 1
MAKAISFFSGAGGLDMGIHQAGFDVKLLVEIEKKFCETLEKNHPNWNVYQGDIMELNKAKIYNLSGLSSDEEVDLIVGGSPCQSFSTAGKRQAFSDPRGAAMLKYAEIVTEIRPKAFLLENVRGLLSAALKHRPLELRDGDNTPLEDEEKRGSALEYLLTLFEGYDITCELVNAANYGVPQTRQRVFIIGTRKDLNNKFEFPEMTHNKNGTDGKLPWVTFEDVVNPSTVTQCTYQSYSEERLKYMKMIPKGGGNWRDLIPYGDDVVRAAMGGAYLSGGGKVGFYRRLHLNKPSPTLLTSPAQKSTNLGHPLEDRPLSIEEYIAIQEFPPSYKLTGAIIEQYTQIGNAVPVRLAKVIGDQILKTIEMKVEVKA